MDSLMQWHSSILIKVISLLRVKQNNLLQHLSQQQVILFRTQAALLMMQDVLIRWMKQPRLTGTKLHQNSLVKRLVC